MTTLKDTLIEKTEHLKEAVNTLSDDIAEGSEKAGQNTSKALNKAGHAVSGAVTTSIEKIETMAIKIADTCNHALSEASHKTKDLVVSAADVTQHALHAAGDKVKAAGERLKNSGD